VNCDSSTHTRSRDADWQSGEGFAYVRGDPRVGSAITTAKQFIHILGLPKLTILQGRTGPDSHFSLCWGYNLFRPLNTVNCTSVRSMGIIPIWVLVKSFW